MPVAGSGGSGGNPSYEKTQVVITKAKNSHNLGFLITRVSSASSDRHLDLPSYFGFNH